MRGLMAVVASDIEAKWWILFDWYLVPWNQYIWLWTRRIKRSMEWWFVGIGKINGVPSNRCVLDFRPSLVSNSRIVTSSSDSRRICLPSICQPLLAHTFCRRRLISSYSQKLGFSHVRIRIIRSLLRHRFNYINNGYFYCLLLPTMDTTPQYIHSMYS